MRDFRGWKSKSGLHSSRKELVETGFLQVTDYQGQYTKLATYYAITWRPLDDTDHSRSTTTAPNCWKKNRRTVCGAGNPTGGVVEVNFGQKR